MTLKQPAAGADQTGSANDQHAQEQRREAQRQAIFVFQATLPEVTVLGSVLHALLYGHLDEELASQVELGAIEALTNIVRHGYAGRSDGQLELQYRENADRLELELIDTGSPIPAGKLELADQHVFDFDPNDLGNLPEHGMGLSLIRALFDNVEYHSAEGRNRMLLTKYLTRRRANSGDG